MIVLAHPSISTKIFSFHGTSIYFEINGRNWFSRGYLLNYIKTEFRKYWHCVSNYLYHKCRRRIALGSRRLLHSGLRFRKLLHCYINIFHQKSTCLDEEMLIKYQQNTFRNSDIPQKLFLPVSQWRPSYSLEHEQYGDVDVMSIIQ